MATLTGKITDVTGRAPNSISSITVKAPSARIGSGTDVIVSSPAEVTFDKTTGDITISGLTGGLSWLYIEGEGWADSIALSVADGMVTLVEAVANAAGTPGIVDYVNLINNAESAIQDFINGLELDTYGGFQDAAVDIDTLLAGGTNSNSRVYYRMARWGSTPNGDSGILDVTNTGYIFSQVFYSTTTSAVYTRTITDRSHIVPGEWLFGEWKKLATHDDLEAKVDKSELAAKADKTYVDDAAAAADWYKGSLGETHLDTIVDTGMRDQHSTPTATVDKGYPEGVRGYLICIRQHGAIASQSYVTTSAYSDPKHWVRTTANAHAEAPTWSPWKLANKGALKLGTADLDTVTAPNDYVQDVGSYATSGRHYPENERGVLKVTEINSSHIHQAFTTATETPTIWTRSQRSGVWEEWALVTKGGDSDGGEPAPAPTNDYPGNPYSHMVRELNLRRRLGHIKTGGKAAVTMIFDHGTKNWRDIVYPALLQRGLTATLAINGSLMENGVARWGHDESITWDTIKSWHNAHMEIANHGMYHDDAPDVASQLVEIRDSREKLESELGITIDTWVGAGISETQMNGFYPVTSISKYADYTAGRIVLDNHAVAFGNTFVPNYTWPMDGTIPQGPIGQWLDRGTQEAWDAIDSAIDHAVAVGGRTIVRCHPQYMGMPNMYTEQFLLDFLDYLKARVDAGEILVLQANRWAVATLD